MAEVLSTDDFSVESGRPDMAAIISAVKKEHRQPRNGVFCCGPQGLVDATRDACVAAADATCTFDVYTEAFAF